MQHNFSASDLEDLKARNLTVANMDKYRTYMENGFPWVRLSANCRPGQEIKILDDVSSDQMMATFAEVDGLKVMKFVPASGAASRMFKSLHQVLSGNGDAKVSEEFSSNLDRFAFSKKLKELAGDGADVTTLIDKLLSPEGLNYAALPKGSILFHKYGNGAIRTAFEEHFYESAAYARSGDDCYLHFTIPVAFESELRDFLSKAGETIGQELGVNFHVETSVQKSETDSPAIYVDNGEWVRDEEDELFFRPAGHGALLSNIDALDADIVFVKNIDNVVGEQLKSITNDSKKILGGTLVHVQNQIFSYLGSIDQGTFDSTSCDAFTQKWLGYSIDGLSLDEVKSLLNRPVRICGMVKNQGEPGGGPFMVKDEAGNESLQIVEKAQINLEDASQAELLSKATHFNPVDLVLGLKDYQGAAFNLSEFSNPTTGMLVEKSLGGKAIKALELPGLWNGAMYYWNTVFVEVPLETFNPVKTVFDLLRPAHL